jgi:hypothetical protein
MEIITRAAASQILALAASVLRASLPTLITVWHAVEQERLAESAMDKRTARQHG